MTLINSESHEKATRIEAPPNQEKSVEPLSAVDNNNNEPIDEASTHSLEFDDTTKVTTEPGSTEKRNLQQNE